MPKPKSQRFLRFTSAQGMIPKVASTSDRPLASRRRKAQAWQTSGVALGYTACVIPLSLIPVIVDPATPTYHYVRSNIDGSLPEHVVFRPKGGTIEIFKFVKPGAASALVSCTMAPGWQSPLRLRSEQLEGVRRRLIATLSYDRANGFATVFVAPTGQPAEPVLVPTPSWHIFNMDLASLAATLAKRRSAFSFHFIEPNMASPSPLMIDLGAFALRPVRVASRRGTPCREWELTGAALGAKRGRVWMALSGYLVEAEIPLPNHPGYRDFSLLLVDRRSMTDAQWRRYVSQTVRGSG